MNCPLCEAIGCSLFLKDRHRSFYFCKVCGLLFVPENEHLTLEDEKKRYELHDNGFGNRGYVQFLEEIAETIEDLGTRDPGILDFGSGKNMVLSGLLQKKGFSCDSYDPLYDIGKECLSKKYDILVLCEVIEHLRDLNHEISVIKKVLDKNGTIILRTNIYPPFEEFRTWWYKEDVTHINFFANKTIETFARMVGAMKVKQRNKDIYILDTDNK